MSDFPLYVRNSIWTNYDAKQAARNAILFQTDSAKLQKKVIAEELDYDNVVKYGLAFEQGEKKVEQMRAQVSGVRQEQERVARLEGKVKQLELQKGGKKTGCRTCTRGLHEGRCPGLDMNCFACRLDGHMKGSKACKKPKADIKGKEKKAEATARQVEDGSKVGSTDSEGCNKVMEVHQVKAEKTKHSMQAKVGLTPIDQGVVGAQATVKLLIDSGVYKTLLSEKDWKAIQQSQGTRKARLKNNRTKFRPFGTNYSLPILGRTKCRMMAACGQEVSTIVYVVAGETESLLGLKDALALGIV